MGGVGTGRGEKRGGGDARDAKRKKRLRYARSASGDVKRDLPHASRGFLVSCDPRQENHCYREACVLLSEQIAKCVPALAPRLESTDSPNPDSQPAPKDTAESLAGQPGATSNVFLPESTDDPAPPVVAQPAATVSDALAAEVSALRQHKRGGDALLSRVDLGVQGSVFIRVSDASVPVDDVVESVLRNARESQTPGSRHCVRFVPAHSTCYAKAADAASAASKVATTHFPPGKCTYAINFKSRMNSDAHRDDFITAIAASIEESEPGRFKVNLDKPDVVLCVEIIKTQCVIGCCRFFHELAKLNIREVSKPAADKEKSKLADKDAAQVEPKATGAADAETCADSAPTTAGSRQIDLNQVTENAASTTKPRDGCKVDSSELGPSVTGAPSTRGSTANLGCEKTVGGTVDTGSGRDT